MDLVNAADAPKVEPRAPLMHILENEYFILSGFSCTRKDTLYLSSQRFVRADTNLIINQVTWLDKLCTSTQILSRIRYVNELSFIAAKSYESRHFSSARNNLISPNKLGY